ncbi:hypothetical protein D3C73_727400 [compost metagenome]
MLQLLKNEFWNNDRSLYESRFANVRYATVNDHTGIEYFMLLQLAFFFRGSIFP